MLWILAWHGSIQDPVYMYTRVIFLFFVSEVLEFWHNKFSHFPLVSYTRYRGLRQSKFWQPLHNCMIKSYNKSSQQIEVMK